MDRKRLEVIGKLKESEIEFSPWNQSQIIFFFFFKFYEKRNPSSKNSFDYRFSKSINLFNVDKKFMVPFF